jgi:hypothetical protein
VRVRPSDGREPPLVSSRHYLKACRVVAVLGADTVVCDRFGRWLLPRGAALRELPEDVWHKVGFAPARTVPRGCAPGAAGGVARSCVARPRPASEEPEA